MQVIITPIEKSLVLQAKGSEILILPDHVSILKGLKKSSDFIEYFKYTALLNRSARKLFEAWLRKDSALWKNIYDTVGKMDDVEVTKIDDISRVDRTVVNPKESEVEKKAKEPKKVKSKKAESEKPVKKIEEPAKEKKPAKKAPAKKAPAKKDVPEEKKVAKKRAAKKATKSPAKKTAKKTTKKTAKVSKTSKKKTTKKA